MTIYQHAVNEYAIKIKDSDQILIQKKLDKFMSRHFDQKYTTGIMFFLLNYARPLSRIVEISNPTRGHHSALGTI